MATVDDLYDVAVLFLAAAEDALALTDAGTPSRSFVGDGQPALDCCGQLVVWNQSLEDFDTIAGQGGLGAQRRVGNIGTIPRTNVFLLATRCVLYEPIDPETSELPAPAGIQATAHMIDQDGWAIYLGISHALRSGPLADHCKGFEFVGAQKITPQGLCVGWQFQWRYQIDPGLLPGMVP